MEESGEAKPTGKRPQCICHPGTIHSPFRSPILTLGVMNTTFQWSPRWAEDLQTPSYSLYTGPGTEADRDYFPIFLDFPSFFLFLFIYSSLM